MARDDLIQFRRGSAVAWATVDPVLALGEPGWDYTSGIIKIGDGSTPWSGLTGAPDSAIAAAIAALPSIEPGVAPNNEIDWVEDGDELQARLRNVPRIIGVNTGLPAGVTGVGPATLLSATITPPANLLASGDLIHVRAHGTLANTGGAADTFQIRLTVGGVELITNGALSVTNSPLGRFWSFESVLKCVFTNEITQGNGNFRLSQPGGGTGLTSDFQVGSATVSVDFANMGDFDMTIQHGSAAATSRTILQALSLTRLRNAV